ncbi:MAG: primosomal protein N' [Chloroflexi bacterium]|nr:primosomal protein N' [Chloroflexota bacterium]
MLPPEDEGRVHSGSLVMVPFGRHIRRGWVVAGAEESPVAPDEMKPLLEVISPQPLLSARELQLTQWLSRRARVSWARAIEVAVPSGVLDSVLPVVRLRRGADAALRERKLLGRLARRLERGEVRLDRAYALLTLDGVVALRALEAAGVVERHIPTPRTGLSGFAPARAGGAPLSVPDRQTRALCSTLFADMAQKRGSLFVVTAAGWPAAAIEQLIQHASKLERQVIVMVPRLPRQRSHIELLREQFGGVLVLDGASQWRTLAERQPLVTIGGRFAPLAPLAHVGLIIVLDEHDAAYGGERAPFVHGREVALAAARLTRASVVLCSPTPDPSTVWRARRAGVQRFHLGGEPEVAVAVVDLHQELQRGHSHVLTEPLQRELSAVLAAGEQALLFLNRRGFAAVLMCRRCGIAVQCAHCSVTLSYHADVEEVRCHLCNFAAPKPEVCPHCLLPSLDELGAGVQRLEAEVQRLFPRARLERWDRDSTVTARSEQGLLTRFRRREIDVLVGTQLVALDEALPPVALAAAALADVGLTLPDYRASERTYELLAALERRVKPGGKLLIQTFQPAHWVFRALAIGQSSVYYEEELRQRQHLRYPPFRQLVRLTCRASSRLHCQQEAEKVRERLVERIAEVAPDLTDAIVGPAPAYIERVNDVYRWQIHLRVTQPQPLLEVVPPHWTVEIDPETVR